MSRTLGTARRRGYTIVVVLVTTFLVLAFAAILSALVVVEWRHDRQMVIETCVNQVIASAQTWSAAHADELVADEPVSLPLDDLLGTGLTGTAELRRVTSATGDELVECDVQVERSGRRVVRRVVWPLLLRADGASPASRQ